MNKQKSFTQSLILKDEKGFSLLETLVVVAIIGILVTVAVPKMEAIRNARVIDAEAALLVGELRYAQELSRTNLRSHNDFPSIKGKLITPKITFMSDEYYLIADTKMIRRHKYPKGLEIRAYNQISFTMNGDTNTPATIALTLGNETRYVIIDVAGRIRIDTVVP